MNPVVVVEEAKKIIDKYGLRKLPEYVYLEQHMDIRKDKPYEALSNAITLEYMILWLIEKAKYGRVDKPLVRVSIRHGTLPENMLGEIVDAILSSVELTFNLALSGNVYSPELSYLEELATISENKSAVSEAYEYLKELIKVLKVKSLSVHVHETSYVGEEGRFVELAHGVHRTPYNEFYEQMSTLLKRKPIAHGVEHRKIGDRYISFYRLLFSQNVQLWVDGDSNNAGFIRLVVRKPEKPDISKIASIEYMYGHPKVSTYKIRCGTQTIQAHSYYNAVAEILKCLDKTTAETISITIEPS